MKLLKYLVLVIGLSISSQMMAQGGVISLIKKVGTLIDTMSVRGVDRRYIEAPEKPWQLIVRGNVSQTIVSMNTKGVIEGMEYDAKPSLRTEPAQYVGLWAGYRGYGLGYTVNVGGDKGNYFTIGATGGSFGINVRIHSFDNSSPNLNLDSDILSDSNKDEWREVKLIDPIHVNTLIADGYYMFNGKKFSYAAAYDQSVIQKRSAGSLMAGAMYFYSNTAYNDDVNADLIMLMDDIGLIRLWQVSAGAGYIYNWVPAKGLLVSAMAIPMLTFYNRSKMYRYDSNLKDVVQAGGYDEFLQMDNKDYRIREAETDPEATYNSNMRVNFDARLSITYEWNERIFLNAFGQFSNFRFKTDNVSGRLNDWYINASIGVRL